MNSIQDPNIWRLSGELTFTTVTTLLKEYGQNTQVPQILDLQAVTHTDSAGVAFLIEMMRRHPALGFRHIPEQLLRIARVYGVDSLLTETAQ